MQLGDDRNLGRNLGRNPGRNLENEGLDALIGTRVGPLVIERLLGEGSMGKVYVAEHPMLKTRRVVKLLAPQLTQNVWLVRRFVNEARAVARLHHRNLIQVHDVGQLPNGAWFMVLDYLDGDTLGRYMATHAGPLPAHAIVHIVCEIANGLQVAHDHQIVHRNLKPDNVFLVIRDGDPYRAVVLDFGVAQLGDEPATEWGTRSGVAIGMPVYLPPEQLRGAKVTPVADVFALGVIAYQMSTGGWFPYQGTESHAAYVKLPATELYHRQTTRAPVDLRDRVPGLSSAWASAIHAAISPDPAQRPASARAFAQRLAEAMSPGGLAPDGLAILRTYARELVDAGAPAGPGPGEVSRIGGPGAVRAQLPSAIPAIPAIPAHVAGPRYQLGDKLGSGGMAEVFIGTMTGAEGFVRRVAIKRVLSGLSQMPTFATMFVAEAQIASQMVHPNIVSVLDFSRDVEDRLFLVMEYVDGKDLAHLLESGPIPPSLALFIVVEMLRGLGYAHGRLDPASGRRGVVHRDVSPQNLLISYEGAVKVSDFGLAKAHAASDGVWSATVRGKPSYMSPEQTSGQVLDGRTDLYAAGVMLWEMLTHQRLFVGTAKEIMGQVIYKEIAAPSTLRDGVPADLEAITMKLLARDRMDRYPTAEVAIEALLACGNVPRDGRGDLAGLLAARFPRGPAGLPVPHSAPAPVALRAQQVHGPVRSSPTSSAIVTASEGQAQAQAQAQGDSPRQPSRAILRPRRGIFAATLSGVILGSLAAALVIARGEVALSGTTERTTRAGAAPAAQPAPAPRPAGAEDAEGAEGAPLDAGVADAKVPEAAPAGHGEIAPSRPPDQTATLERR
jgi:eukaryotic-like serine/threonine-protein kinase